jgi:hypothetical protein
MVAATPYEALVQSAASLTATDLIADIDGCDLTAVSTFLKGNVDTLELARHALGTKCVVPLRYEESFYSEHVGNFTHLRNLARAFQAEARWAARHRDFGTVAKVGLDILELANSIRRGGLVTDFLVAIAISGIALETLRKNRSRFDGATRYTVIRELQRLETEREPLAEIIARDVRWENAVGHDDEPANFMSRELSDPEECGLSEDEQKEILQLLQQVAELPKSDLQKMHFDQDCRIIALMRMLIIDLALRDQHQSSGYFVEQLSSLAPELVCGIPVDPFTDEPFIYRCADDNSFHLYSTGPKKRDGGGQIGPWPSVVAGCADLFLDAGDYWSS